MSEGTENFNQHAVSSKILVADDISSLAVELETAIHVHGKIRSNIAYWHCDRYARNTLRLGQFFIIPAYSSRHFAKWNKLEAGSVDTGISYTLDR